MFAAELFRAFHEATNQTVLVRIWLWDKSLFDLAFVKFLYHITPLATWAVWTMKVEDAQPKFTYIIINSKALKTRAYFWKWAHLVPTKLNKTNLGTFSGHLLCCFPRTVQIFSRGYNTGGILDKGSTFCICRYSFLQICDVQSRITALFASEICILYTQAKIGIKKSLQMCML